MAFTVPPSVNYPSPLNAFPCRFDNTPNEGFKQIPVEVDWGTMGGTSKSVYVNLQDNSTLVFSQIQALSIDNSQCGSDVTFIFADNSETVTIPAYSPKVIVPVFSNQVQFYVQCLNEESEDITRFLILNFLPPPLAVPTSQEQQVAAIQNISFNSGTTQIVPANINGTLESAYITAGVFDNGAGGGSTSFSLADGTGKVVAVGNIGVPGNSGTFGVLFQNDNMRVRFQGGLVMTVTSINIASGDLAANLYYRTP